MLLLCQLMQFWPFVNILENSKMRNDIEAINRDLVYEKALFVKKFFPLSYQPLCMSSFLKHSGNFT